MTRTEQMISRKAKFMVENKGFSKGQAVMKLYHMYSHLISVEEIENIVF